MGEEQVLFEKIQDELELVELRPLISMAQKGGVEKIVNLPGVLWMKFEKKELFRDSIATSDFVLFELSLTTIRTNPNIQLCHDQV